MVNFDEAQILANAQRIYGMRAAIEAAADEIWNRGFDLLFFTSSGGSLAMMEPFRFWIDTASRLSAASMTAADFLVTGCSHLTDRSVVFLTSKSGDTKETLEAAAKARNAGAWVVSVAGVPDSPLEQLSDRCLVYENGRPQELIFYLLIGRILYKNGDFPAYPEFADNMKHLGAALASVRIQADEAASRYAAQCCREPYNIWIASGDLWPVAYSFSMCVLEESLWIRTKSVTSPEFFHGTMELLEKDVCVTLLLTEGPTRPLDERVRRFAMKHTQRLYCFDAKDYELPGIQDAFRPLLSPVVMGAALQRISKNMEAITGHSLDIRRYYRKGAY